MKALGLVDRWREENIGNWLVGSFGAKFKSELAEIGQNDENFNKIYAEATEGLILSWNRYLVDQRKLRSDLQSRTLKK